MTDDRYYCRGGCGDLLDADEYPEGECDTCRRDREERNREAWMHGDGEPLPPFEEQP